MKKIIDFSKEYTIVYVLFLLAIIFYFGNNSFIKASNFLTILRQSSILGIAAIGGMFVMVSGGINLAIGPLVSIVTVITAILCVNFGMNWGGAMLVAVLVATVISTFMGWVIQKTKIWAMIGTYAFNIIIGGLAYIICGGLPVYGIPSASKILGQGFIGFLPVPVLMFVITAVLAAFFLNKTYLGRQFYASGSNDEAARLSGINTNRIRIFSYTISGLLCGIAGIVMYGRVGSGQPLAGNGLEMDALTATVIGGVSLAGGEGKVFKACSGVLLISMLTNGLTLMNIDEYTQMVIRGIIFVAAVILDSYQHMEKIKSKKIENPLAETTEK
ncbi:ABC transporter permease [uncultured Sphaerochaeta sp.]|uniref:ABC transporter permease n=1 Tax=uncultured Sphaerochaeta sp. TaxID=886478 RepID=UPI002A0A52F1|nr:ABC transporter permease [uncultured Sphaerochaeta sp.]